MEMKKALFIGALSLAPSMPVLAENLLYGGQIKWTSPKGSANVMPMELAVFEPPNSTNSGKVHFGEPANCSQFFKLSGRDGDTKRYVLRISAKGDVFCDTLFGATLTLRPDGDKFLVTIKPKNRTDLTGEVRLKTGP